MPQLSADKLLALLCGIMAVSHFPRLPDFHRIYLLPVVVLIVALMFFRPARIIGMAALGICWGIIAGHQLLDRQLPINLEGVELRVRGDIVDLPQALAVGQRFLFRVDEAENMEEGFAKPYFQTPARVLLTWYGDKTLAVGQRWQFVVKLKKPRALVNEGGFDYQRWLLSRGISATGYIRQSAHTAELQPQQFPSKQEYPVQYARSRVRDWIQAHASPDTQGPLMALAIGDTSYIDPQQWQLFRQTGTGHLMAISGLHIGLIAVFGFLLGRGIATAITLAGNQWRCLRVLPNLMSCVCAALYAALAGFGLPTQRALVMVLLLNAGLILGRGHKPLRALMLAALVVLLFDPLAGLDMGFWLSFGAVAVLVLYFQSRHQTKTGTIPGYGKIIGFIRAQGVVFIGLLLPLLAFNTPLSLLAPLANLLAIPVVSLFAVIPLLLGIALQNINALSARLCLNAAEATLHVTFQWLQTLAALDLPAYWSPSGSRFSIAMILFAIAGVVVVLLARGFPGRWLGGLLLLPILFPGPSRQEPSAQQPLRVTVLDVGQGLAVVVRTPEHTLLYDAGARFSERFDIGEAVVLPYLRYHGIQSIDTFVISHGDNDHAGGAWSVVGGIKINRVIVGEALEDFPLPVETCDRNMQWQWQGVSFALIEPQTLVAQRDNNNLSCVLLITYAGQHLLLPGDIEAPVEKALLQHRQIPSPLQTVIAPHHGSRTSSTSEFVKYLQADRAIFSAAYRSRYGHPHPLVVERYRKNGAVHYNTADAGQIDLRWSGQGEVQISQLRQSRLRYWY